jgi:formylglycine-generating enzyme required for sulfatase activity
MSLIMKRYIHIPYALLIVLALALCGAGQAPVSETKNMTPPVVKKKITGVLKKCPEDMQYVIVDYNPRRVYEVCIDRYEYPNKVGERPMVDVSWYGAKKRCKEQGKYLCWDKEWIEACMGLDNWDFSYYNVYDPEKCNVNGETFDRIGDNKECKTHHYEVYDLVGNVREWVGGGGIGVVGGSYKHGRGARCSRWDQMSVKRTYQDVGFRCCARVNTGRYSKVKKGKAGK